MVHIGYNTCYIANKSQDTEQCGVLVATCVKGPFWSIPAHSNVRIPSGSTVCTHAQPATNETEYNVSRCKVSTLFQIVKMLSLLAVVIAKRNSDLYPEPVWTSLCDSYCTYLCVWPLATHSASRSKIDLLIQYNHAFQTRLPPDANIRGRG